MNRRFPWSLGLVLFLAVTGCAAGYGQAQMGSPPPPPGGPVSVSYFYDALSSDGQWFQDPNYGWCWTPYDLSADWRPYSDGKWVYTDYGWSWASNESYGWATYHYGRWFFDDSYGWAWVPGTEWAPAWVAWRSGDDWIGWAPLPPTARWDDSAGLAFNDVGAIPSDEWCFVPRQHMLDASLSLQVTSVARNVTLLERSRDATRFEVRSGRPANIGIDITLFEKSIGRPVPREHIVDVESPTRGSGRPAGNGNVSYFRPAVRPAAPDQRPAPAMQPRANPIADADMQRLRDDRQRKLESDLAAERGRLAKEQQNESRAEKPGPAADAVQQRHVVEQQAFDAHAARARQVMGQRLQKQVVRPDKGNNGKGKGNNGNGKGNNGNDKGNNGNDKGNGKGDK